MDPDGSNVLGYIILLLLLILLNAFFAMAELAVVSLNDNKIRRLAEDGDKKAARLLRFINEPTNFLSTIQIGVTLSGFLASAVAADTFAEIIVQRFSSLLPISPSTLRLVSLVVITLLLSYVTLIFGELVPKRIAMQHYEKISFSIAGILTVIASFLKPFVFVVSASTNAVLKLIGIDPNHQPEEVTEEEIRMMLDVGKESGHIHESDKDMIYNIFEFDDRYVEDVMTHRTEIVAVERDSTLDEIYEIAVESGYSRIPVYEEDLDNIVGVLYVKDLLHFSKDKEARFDIENYLRAPLYTIETTTCKTLLAQFKETKIQMAIVVDEYGGTAGLVSMEDLMEAIVGNIQDEYDDEEEDILEIGENIYLANGLMLLEDAVPFFGLSASILEEDFDTLGGYILNQIGQIPGEDERPTVQVERVLFSVQEMDERRISKLRVELLADEPENTEEEESDSFPFKRKEKIEKEEKNNKNGKEKESPATE